MDRELKFLDGDDSISERRRTEIDYHRKLNVRIALVCAPIFFILTIFFFMRASLFQGSLFFLMTVNAVVIVALVSRTDNIDRLMRLKHVGSANAFGLLGVSLISALFGEYLYILAPYIFIYPIASLLFFGERTGRYYAVIFCLVAITLVMVSDISSWDLAHFKTFKLNTAAALVITLVISLISERTRVQIRDKLIAARHHAEDAETRQRQTNSDLKQEIQRRTQSEEALSQSEKRYRALFEESAVTLWEEDWSRVRNYLEGLPKPAAENLRQYLGNTPGEIDQCTSRMRVLAVNQAALKLYEANERSALMNKMPWIDSPEFNVSAFMAERLVGLCHNNRHETDGKIRTLSGRELHVIITTTIPNGYEDSWEKVYTSVYDITEKIAMEQEKKRLDLQVQHTRHFQAIATLAGGIAHQFNNALGGIYGNLDLLEFKFNFEGKSKRYIEALRKSSSRIARLTEQLLAYARGGKFQPKAISINAMVKEILSTDITPQFPKIRITMDLAPDLHETIGDETQIRAAVAATLVNAMEAEVEDGEVRVTTINQHIDQDHLPPGTELADGDYVVTTIVDHGTGMDEQTLQQIFEPFFTTKFVGRGLGMSAAYGIIKNHGGDITLASKLGEGTSVTIYLPCEEPGP